eukprot:TRINITY_DN12287_c2_g1_i1.p1 TRINITY_DN12287_c2_g1~~TRINITY_DN12287_c2_g1_i1.p1  ORF type:complete len:429 (+),score=100.13 TRINITY_DN12287_c2_g1_i1:116-1402(+)
MSASNSNSGAPPPPPLAVPQQARSSKSADFRHPEAGTPTHVKASAVPGQLSSWLPVAVSEATRYGVPPPPFCDGDFGFAMRAAVGGDAHCLIHAPAVFAELRRLLLPPDLRLVDAVWEDAGRSAGKSGSNFARSSDGMLLAKSVHESELDALKRLLPDMFHHVSRRQESLLNVPLGIFVCERTNHKREPVVVIMNLLPLSGLAMLFDLKGSTHGRSASADERRKPVPTLKDNEWREMDLWMDVERGEDLGDLRLQLASDCALLERHGLMDYSFLLGIRMRAPPDRGLEDMKRNCLRGRSGKVYYFGVIDFLSPYGTSKKIANTLKGITSDATTISSVPPDQYAARFMRFFDEFIARVKAPPDPRFARVEMPDGKVVLRRAVPELDSPRRSCETAPWRPHPKSVPKPRPPPSPLRDTANQESSCRCAVM